MATIEDIHLNHPGHGWGDLKLWLPSVARYEKACWAEQEDFDPVGSALLKEARAKADGKYVAPP